MTTAAPTKKKAKRGGQENAPPTGEHEGTHEKAPQLPGMPVPAKTKLRAEELAGVLDDLANVQTRVEDRKAALIGQMKADKITTVKCRSAAGFEHEFDLETGLEKLKHRAPKD